MKRTASLLVVLVAAAFAVPSADVAGQATSRLRAVQAATTSLRPGQSNAAALEELRAWDAAVTDGSRTGTLVRSSFNADTVVVGRSHERFIQYHGGVRVFGGSVARQLNQFGETQSVFGTVYEDVDVDVVPALNQGGAALRLAAVGRGTLLPGDPVELTVLPTQAGYRLTWTARVASLSDGHEYRIFIDAASGAEVLTYDDTWTQIPTGEQVGVGTGVAGDRLKVSVSSTSVGYQTVDRLRPGQLTTYDLKGDPQHADDIRRGRTGAGPNDIGNDADNNWTDAGITSGHAYSGLTYDYLRQRHNWMGIDNQSRQVQVFVNPADPANQPTQGSQFPLFFNNAFYSNSRTFYGVGSASWRNFAGALDVVAHELSHGVTRFTSNLIYRNESGALNEAFSDMMGAAAEFHFQPRGQNIAQADWFLGEDLGVTGGFIRSMSNPPLGNDPDHYSNKFTGSSDNGGVHINSGIINHMFYLAIMGGTNRVSGLPVEGVGFENRAQIEQVIFRGFTQMLTENATFSMARAATIQAARDLFGAGSTAESVMIQAWNAVGVL